MGQRLNVEIIYNDELLANCYYHWGGYSLASIDTIKPIITYFNKNQIIINEKNKKDIAIDLLELTGASYPGIDRNEGLIEISKEEMESTRLWENARVSIDISKEEINYYCYYVSSEDHDLFNSNFYILIKSIDRIEAIPFSKINDLKLGIKKAIKCTDGLFSIGNSYYSAII